MAEEVETKLYRMPDDSEHPIITVDDQRLERGGEPRRLTQEQYERVSSLVELIEVEDNKSGEE